MTQHCLKSGSCLNKPDARWRYQRDFRHATYPPAATGRWQPSGFRCACATRNLINSSIYIWLALRHHRRLPAGSTTVLDTNTQRPGRVGLQWDTYFINSVRFVSGAERGNEVMWWRICVPLIFHI